MFKVRNGTKKMWDKPRGFLPQEDQSSNPTSGKHQKSLKEKPEWKERPPLMEQDLRIQDRQAGLRMVETCRRLTSLDTVRWPAVSEYRH